MAQNLALNTEINFMNGVNFKLSPLQRLKFILASSIFGEPQYYRDGVDLKNGKQKTKFAGVPHKKHQAQLLFPELMDGTNVVDFTIRTINASLDFDFEKTLELANTLRNTHMMRKNPQVIIILAALHKNRQQFNCTHPKLFRESMKNVIQRPDDMLTQLELYTQFSFSFKDDDANKDHRNKMGKSKLPGVIKRGWCDVLESLTAYQINKYLNQAKLIDLIRLAHPNPKNNALLTEVVKNGAVAVLETEKTWESLKAEGKTWIEILAQINIPHMALLRNLRNIAAEVDAQQMEAIMQKLVKGVLYGKQFPFRYYTAYNQFKTNATTPLQPKGVRSAKYHEKIDALQEKLASADFAPVRNIILDGLEKCIDEAIANFPSLDGDTMSLCDNSGSARGTFNSTYGSVQVSTIANLSALITAMKTKGTGYVGVFGDKLEIYTVQKDKPVLKQLDEIERLGTTVGGGTENGIWLWFDRGLKMEQKCKVDNLFIYSDMQAGHGRLYGCNQNEYKDYAYNGSNYIDVLKLVDAYRAKINKKLNVFSVQVAGYDNNVLPENLYRGALLTGWTGNEVVYASEIISLWNDVEEYEFV
jgi:hypothetical protein